MKKFIATLTILLFFSCQQPETNNKLPLLDKDSSTILDGLVDLPDTVLASPNINENKFELNLSSSTTNEQYSKFEGEWICKTGGLTFLKSKVDIEDKVVFSNKSTVLMTGWGEIKFNRSVKFYTTESSNYQYDYFIDDDGKLNIIEYDYRNDDLSIKKEPVPIFEKLNINWLNKNQFEFVKDGIRFKMERNKKD